MSRPSAAGRDLPRVPPVDLGAQPEARPPMPEVEDGSRHVWIPVDVEAHSVSVGEAENTGDLVCIDQIVEKYAAGHPKIEYTW
jgi:hypothetical protein